MNSRGFLVALALSAAFLVVSLVACAGRRLPPGTPPPEYEPPIVTRWPPETPETGSAGAGPASAPEGAAPVSSAGAGKDAELSLDAGPR